MAHKSKFFRKPIRIGVVGVGRGEGFIHGAGPSVGMDLVAICDIWKERLEEIGKKYSVKTYTDYDKFLEQGMDAVVIANYFNEHTPFAIKALLAGKHVMSETSCNATLAEGVELCRIVEKTGLIYMLAENYPYTKFNMEMRRLYRTDEIGEVTYAEGEYNHPLTGRVRLTISPGMEHWRNWIPSTYYCTHALAPLIYITDTMPVKVNGLSIAYREIDDECVRVSDPGSVILCRMNNGAIFRIFGVLLPGHSNWYRLHGKHGAMEITRGPGYFGPEQVRIWHETWDQKTGESCERTYVPDWPKHGDLASETGHGGGDFWMNFEFANAIRNNRQPFFDVYRGVTMSSVGILAWKSALEDGKPLDVPNFKKESDRKKYENDTYSPFPSHWKQGYKHLQPSILGTPKPSKKGIAIAKQVWKDTSKLGYRDR